MLIWMNYLLSEQREPDEQNCQPVEEEPRDICKDCCSDGRKLERSYQKDQGTAM
jgi:hypothetical protein